MKYTFYSTKADWEELYREAKKLGASDEYIKSMKKSTSYDTQYTLLQVYKRKLQEAQSNKPI